MNDLDGFLREIDGNFSKVSHVCKEKIPHIYVEVEGDGFLSVNATDGKKRLKKHIFLCDKKVSDFFRDQKAFSEIHSTESCGYICNQYKVTSKDEKHSKLLSQEYSNSMTIKFPKELKEYIETNLENLESIMLSAMSGACFVYVLGNDLSNTWKMDMINTITDNHSGGTLTNIKINPGYLIDILNNFGDDKFEIKFELLLDDFFEVQPVIFQTEKDKWAVKCERLFKRTYHLPGDK